MSYDLVEFATAVKPLLLQGLLGESEQVFYLDPDTYVTSPMVELGPALDASSGGILLTPHFLRRPAARRGDRRRPHAPGRRQQPRLLRRRPPGRRLPRLVVGPSAHRVPLRPAGRAVRRPEVDGHRELPLRGRHLSPRRATTSASPTCRSAPLAEDDDGYVIASTGERLRLFHFHAFDSNTPEKLSVRYRHTTDNELQDDSVVLQLCKEYAGILSVYEQALPPAPSYPYAVDTRGVRISRQLRRAYLRETLRTGRSVAVVPFEPSDADAFSRWRRRAWRPIARGLLSEAAKCLRIVLPEEYDSRRRSASRGWPTA